MTEADELRRVIVAQAYIAGQSDGARRGPTRGALVRWCVVFYLLGVVSVFGWIIGA